MAVHAALHPQRSGNQEEGRREKPAQKIKHIVVLMEENRSFDHLLGWYRRPSDKSSQSEDSKTTMGKQVGLDGLRGDEFNFVNVSSAMDGTNRTKANKVFVDKLAPYINVCDPDHNLHPTTFKIFGPDPRNCSLPNSNHSDPTMSGFVMFERDHYLHSAAECGVLSMFDTRAKLPVLTKLVDEFAVMDQFFASVPGPTWPNRQFFMSGQSNGLMATNPWFRDHVGELYPQETIFDQITQLALDQQQQPKTTDGTDSLAPSWKVYFGDAPWELYMEALAHSPEHIQPLDQFLADASSGQLPSFSFIDPRAGVNTTSGQGCNDEHPDHDVAVAESFYKQVYEALRQGPAWNETLFVLTYDEHGGFFDHVKTPLRQDGVPEPIPFYQDASIERLWWGTAEPKQAGAPGNVEDHQQVFNKGRLPPSFPDPGFTFDRLGLRVPTVLISPWIDQGTVISKPDTGDSFFDLTSIISTARKLLFPGDSTPAALTARDAWSATFEGLFELRRTPRADCPWTLPNAPPVTLDPEDEAKLPVNSLQSHIGEIHRGLLAPHYDEHEEEAARTRKPAVQGEVSEHLQKQYHEHSQRTLHWKCTKAPQRLSNATSQLVPLHGRRSHLLSQHRQTHCDPEQPFDHHRAQMPEGGSSTTLLRYEVQVVPSSFLFTTFPFQFTLNKPNNTSGGPDDRLRPVYYETLSIELPVYNSTLPGHSPVKAAFCLDTPARLDVTGGQVGISLCYPSKTPGKNRDPGQWWVWYGDSTIRPALNSSMCLKNEFFTSLNGTTNRTAWLAPCHHSSSVPRVGNERSEILAEEQATNFAGGNPVDDVEEHYAYGGKAPGETYDGQIAFGITSLMIVPIPARKG